ncbi:MAG: cyclic nucleotide-binding domain-containing protein [Candidatus Tectomicrobia bacterium]|uniref:Cyclic nucleotide-binding domain-containing protein n=1 Tax=Tectimicrobiota bacterium TaxID=2528274 RepID=A0A933LPB8_UNCTE|nr:cyclic nucleotide-binding domain-containing protein [Candidatus Tectomicrobia bacterium]
MKEGELGKTYTDGEIIFAEGDRGEVMYIIQSGKVRLTKKTPQGEIELAVLGSGEILGEMSLFDRLTRSATAVAMGKARILSVDKKKLFSTINGDPTIAFKIIETMCRRIRKLDQDFSELMMARVHESQRRIAYDC